MKKSIIISGPPASGKTWVAEAIALTHEDRKVLRMNVPAVHNALEEYGLPTDLQVHYSLMIVDECTIGDIYELVHLLKNPVPEIHPWSGEIIDTSNHLTVVFLTQDNVPHTKSIDEMFHLINFHGKEESAPKTNENIYFDTFDCDHCGKETQHEVRGSGHERDSSHDTIECTVCHYWKFLHDDEYQPPIAYED